MGFRKCSWFIPIYFLFQASISDFVTIESPLGLITFPKTNSSKKLIESVLGRSRLSTKAIFKLYHFHDIVPQSRF